MVRRFAALVAVVLAASVLVASPAHAVGEEVDLAITVTGPTAPVVPGTDFSWTINVANNGPFDSLGSTVTDVLPPELTFVTGEACSADGQVVTCQVDAVPFDGFWQFELITTLSPDAAEGTVIANSATVTSGPTEVDLTPANDSSGDSIEVSDGLANVASVAAALDVPVAGQTMRWQLTASNSGPSTAKNVVFTKMLAAGLTFASATPDVCTAVLQVVTCNIGDVSPEAPVVVTVSTSVSLSALLGTVFTNTLTQSSDTSDTSSEDDSTSAASAPSLLAAVVPTQVVQPPVTVPLETEVLGVSIVRGQVSDSGTGGTGTSGTGEVAATGFDLVPAVWLATGLLLIGFVLTLPRTVALRRRYL